MPKKYKTILFIVFSAVVVGLAPPVALRVANAPIFTLTANDTPILTHATRSTNTCIPVTPSQAWCSQRHPNDAWTAQQHREATPYNKRRKYLIRDNDKKYGIQFSAVARSSGIKEIKTPFESHELMPSARDSLVRCDENAETFSSSCIGVD
jgi:hypothetical protein